MTSKHIVYIGFIFIFITSFFYYPKWNKPGSEATIGWDVSGYYWYLPSMFIYKDLKEQKFAPAIMQKYAPTPQVEQYFKNRNGYYVMKYSIGQAIQYSPFFFIAHLLAKPLGFEADGFSAPYQFAIQFGSLVICFIGLWFMRKALLEYFSDKVTTIVIAALILATNYFNYTAIDNAMTHNWLFSWYAMLIYFTIQFYKNPEIKNALKIGGIVGICALTRPTDIVCVIIPLLWGMTNIGLESIKERIQFLFNQKALLGLAAAVTLAIGFIQLAYFKYAGGEWIVYSYQDQTFSWLHPHFKDYMISFRTGWLLYTPVFLLSIVGIYFIIKRKLSWLALVGFAVVNTYIVVCWDIWWYGGRAMIQSYPILAFLMASTVEKMLTKNYLSYIMYVFIGLCAYYNIWWTHGVHRGGFFDAYNMTKAYYYNQLGKWSLDMEAVKLYDTDELFKGSRKNTKVVYENNFDADSVAIKSGKQINGSPADFIAATKQNTVPIDLPIKNNDATWLRINNTIQCTQKEWNVWLMPQVVVKFFNHGNVIKQNSYRPHRFLNDGQIADQFFDVKIPDKPFNKVQLMYWNSDGTKETYIDNIRVEVFD